MVLRIEKAKIEDVPYIHRLINRFAARGEMLPRPLSEIYENIRDFFAARSDGEVVGCASLHILWADLAEIKGMAVVEEERGQRIGTSLAKECLEDAKNWGFPLSSVSPTDLVSLRD